MCLIFSFWWDILKGCGGILRIRVSSTFWSGGVSKMMLGLYFGGSYLVLGDEYVFMS